MSQARPRVEEVSLRHESVHPQAIETLARGAGVTGGHSRQRDLKDIAGTWRKDRAFDLALAAQDTVDEALG